MPVNENKEKKFYEALEKIFTGANIEGKGGFINLLKIKSAYYKKILIIFKKQVDENGVIKSVKEEFFDRLFTFFDRYFSECGSVYFVKTADWQKVYEKVYTDNNDVVLFWKTNMLYYVKSDIMFKSMDNISVEDEIGTKHNFFFNCKDLENKQNNEKKKITFTYKKTEENNKYFFEVSYSGKDENTDDILKAIKKDRNVISEDTLKKAFAIFKKQASVDLFINKNAKEFLTEQLDMYLHQILLDEKNEFEVSRLAQLKTVKEFSLKIIDFISQFEDELVRIWNKPKFVLNSNYVITMDKLTPEIIKKLEAHSGWKEQTKEWEELEMQKGKQEKSLFNEPTCKLPIDTKYFKDLEIEILSLFDNLDEALDGCLIKSENYQALNTWKDIYKEKIQCIYIDPPFNTGNDNDFAYIDGYQDSTWLSIMRDRLDIANTLLSENASFYLHLDYRANYLGKMLLNKYFDQDHQPNEIIWRFGWVSGYKAGNPNIFLRNHQTIFRCIKNKGIFNSEKALMNYETFDSKSKKAHLDDFVSNLGFTPSDIDWKQSKITIQKKNGNLIKLDDNRKECGHKATYPYEDVWNTGNYDTLHSILITSFSEEKVEEAQKLTQKPEKLLQRIIEISTNEKDIVCDFFCGSGTTIATAQKLNRKWLGIELGEHYYDTILPRIKETLNPKSKREPTGITNAINWQGGGFFKYYELEQYEETLNKMKYSEIASTIFDETKPFANYIFLTDEKLSGVLDINTKNNVVNLDLDKLYEDKKIDLPETISLIKGKAIKKITVDSVVLEDNETIRYDYKKFTDDEKVEFVKLLKPLLWWGKE